MFQLFLGSFSLCDVCVSLSEDDFQRLFLFHNVIQGSNSGHLVCTLTHLAILLAQNGLLEVTVGRAGAGIVWKGRQSERLVKAACPQENAGSFELEIGAGGINEASLDI